MRTALILGGTGQIGRPAARRLAEDGWEVTIAARAQPDDLTEFRFARVDRTVPGELENAVGDGVDLLVDIWAMTADDARQLVALAGRVGSVIAASTAAVYCDDEGRSLKSTTGAWDFPRFPVPMPERQRTVEPGDDGYAPRKSAVEKLLLEAPELRATVLRLGAIHGPHTKHSREWYFVQRALDGRRAVILANRGESRFNTTSVANIAELVALTARRPRSRALNCADPDPPTAVGIARAIGAVMGHEWVEVLMPGPEEGTVGDHPWNVPRPFVLDMTEAEVELGYRPVTTYAKAVPETVAWLLEAMRDRPWSEVLTGSPYLETMFDYAAEDAYLRNLNA
jgi:nucleoside-diphosphate-sugar epimerase